MSDHLATDMLTGQAKAALEAADKLLPAEKLQELLGYEAPEAPSLPGEPSWLPTRAEVDNRGRVRRERDALRQRLEDESHQAGVALANARVAVQAAKAELAKAGQAVAELNGVEDPRPAATAAAEQATADAESALTKLEGVLAEGEGPSVVVLAARVADLGEKYRAARDLLARAELAAAHVRDTAKAQVAAADCLEAAGAEAEELPRRRAAAEARQAAARAGLEAAERGVASAQAAMNSTVAELRTLADRVD